MVSIIQGAKLDLGYIYCLGYTHLLWSAHTMLKLHIHQIPFTTPRRSKPLIFVLSFFWNIPTVPVGNRHVSWWI
jgi:hypothetical protein